MADDLAQAQAGVVARRQLLALGVTPGAVGARLDAGRWTPVLPGVYLTGGAAPEELVRAWAALLYAGEGAVLAGRTALRLWGVLDAAPATVSVCVPARRRVRDQPGVRVVTRSTLDADTHPGAVPPRLRVEPAVLDAVAGCSDEAEVVALLLRAVQGRHTTAGRLRSALAATARQRHRALVLEVLADVDDGVRSMLELRWARDVDRAHRLPGALRNAAEVVHERGRRRRRYRDVEYVGWGLVVELDGRAAHPDDEAFRDRDRDNALAANGTVSLRYGWTEVVREPCAVAAQVVAVLRRLGWTGRPRACGPRCTVDG